MQTNYAKLKALLRDLFQMDQADLDFGLYRIMNAKRDEIERFLEHDLLPQVKTELARHTGLDSGAKKAELDEAIKNAKGLGFDPDTAPRVMALRDELKHGTDLDALENEVFSHLCNFFRRYYHQGDFLSLRRYKEGVYAIPYEGEEVKLYWANHDQYYIKSTEYLRNYAFKLRDGRRVHFTVVEAEADVDNNKPQTGKERRFSLVEANPVVVENGELSIRFNYQTDPRKQAELNTAAVTAVLGNASLTDWLSALGELRPTEKDKQRTLLAKHLDDFTARYAFDYFIHKNLGGFLRRELDFFIKNEIMHLDDVEDEAAPKVQLYLSKIKALRKIAHKVIAFLEQLENFQKKMWLKKKFVVETNYCVTLDLVPEELYPQIIQNKPQIEEWKRLFTIQDIERSTISPGYAEPLVVDFLKANPFLPLDTKYFTAEFRDRCLAHHTDLDSSCGGVVVQSDNQQALRLMLERYRNKVGLIYIDPPYNTGSDDFIYKDSYQHSSWLTLMRPVLCLAREVLNDSRALFVSINDNEAHRLVKLLQDVFGEDNFVAQIVWEKSKRGDAKLISISHEYILVIAKDKTSAIQAGKWRRRKPGVDEVLAKYDDIRKALGEDHEVIAARMREWYNSLPKDDVRRNHQHYRCSDKRGLYFPDNFAGPDDGRESRPRYDIIHPVTGKPCKKPSTGWRWDEETTRQALSEDPPRIHFGPDETTIPCRKSHLEQVDCEPFGSVFFRDGRAGTLEVEHMVGAGLIEFPKDKETISDLIALAGARKSTVLDFFAGSGTTGHAVIHGSRQDHAERKYVLVEMGSHFDTLLLPRLKKAIYSNDWKERKPVSRDGVSHMLKYLRLESYDDCLNNLELKRTAAQDDLLTRAMDFREDYTLRYMLDVEARGSASLLNVQKFTDPFSYKLKVSTGTVGETKEVNVDLVETFNWLVGLTVKHTDHIRGVRVVEGTNPQGDRVLILWRNIAEVPNDKLDEWFKTQGYNTRDQECDLIYVNGDNNLENLRRGDQTWKVRLIEEDFHRLMWECQDV